MFKKLIQRISGDPQQKLIESFQESVVLIAGYEPTIEQLTNEELRDKTAEFRGRLADGESLDSLLPEAFAVVREASKRTTGMRHYDVQIMGGSLMHDGEVIEMRTGEGKTLVATGPLYLNALTGKGVHLVTVNEYLARRDGGWMGKIFHALGLSVAVIGPLNYSALYDQDYVNPGTELEDERLVHWRPCTRQEAYQSDITYGIASEFGFDYLRDNLVNDPTRLTQKPLHFAIIDEVDNILIDEARTPLIISGPADRTGKEYERFASYVRGLKRNTAEEDEPPTGDFDLDEKSRTVSLTELGIAKVEQRIPEIDIEMGESLYDPRFNHLTYYVDNAVKAEYLFKRDHQYVVKNGEVLIVDDFTGRLMPGRRYSDGLHEAIEAKEGVQVQRENVTVATITLQNYFRMYDKLAGMTGTAVTDAEEFKEIYDVDVTALPTNVQYLVDAGTMGLQERRRKLENTDEIYYVQPGSEDPIFFKRTDFKDQVYLTEPAKDEAIVDEIKRVNATGQPVLVGTTSVEHSELIHKMLQKGDIAHNVLNAKIHQSEALVVAQAGRLGAVTISTNMAGRGTDILLGGNPEGLASETLEDEMFDRGNLRQLATTLINEGKEAALAQANRHSKLPAEMVDALDETRQIFDSALKEIEKVQVAGYVARQLQEAYQLDYSEALQITRMARSGLQAQARQQLKDAGKDVAVVEDSIRLSDLYARYQSAKNQPGKEKEAEFICEYAFDNHYNGRAALIRAILGDEKAEAERIVETVPGLSTQHIQRIEEVRKLADKQRQKVWELGGLHVVGSERHESRRIDNQLRGRAARQGDPGSSRFFLSLEDDLMKRFGGERLKNVMTRLSQFVDMPEDMPIEDSRVDKLIENSQERLEGYNFDMRKNVVEYDDVMNAQRQSIYDERREILTSESTDLDDQIGNAFQGAISQMAHNYLDDYPGFVQGEIDRTLALTTTDATNTINVNGALLRLRSLLPGISDLDREALSDASEDKLRAIFMDLGHDNLDAGRNIYQFLQAAGRFIPLMPPIPNLAGIMATRKTGYSQVKEQVRQEFATQAKNLFTEFLSIQIDELEHENIWQTTAQNIDSAFSQFNVNASLQTMKLQQPKFHKKLEGVLRNLLVESVSALDSDQLVSALTNYVDTQQDKWRQQIGEEEYKNFQRLLLLRAIDREWRDYLTAMDDLRREIGLESIAQRDPKVEYKRRSYEMFADMRGNIDESVADRFFREIAGHHDFVRRQQQAAQMKLQLNQSGYQVVERGKGKRQTAQVRRDAPKVGRNDPCPCGSGKKYKHCHMKQDQKAAAPAKNGQPAGKTKRRKVPSGKRRRRR